MLYVTYALNALLMMTLPLGLGWALARRLQVRWGLFGIGAVTFIASQVVHIPLNLGLTWLAAHNYLPTPPTDWKLLTNAIILGLSAGLCEEIARYLVYRWWLKAGRTWREGLMFGAGHGGVEAILFGALAFYAFLQLSALRTMDLSTLPLTAEQLATLQQQVADYWASPWYATLLGAVERAGALCFHLSATLLVLQAFSRNNPLWLGAAILWHAFVDALAVYVLQIWGIYWTEATLVMIVPISLGLIFALRRPEPVVVPLVEAAPAVVPTTPIPPEPSPEKLDDTRYQ